MKLSILPLLIIVVFAFCIFITKRAGKNQSVNAKEALSIYLLLAAFGLWTGISILMGIQGLHIVLMDRIQLLWQANVAIVILVVALAISPVLRSALRGVASGTPWHWLVFVQALRIGAIGTVVKVLQGDVTSVFPLWVGIPDFLFGLSALLVGWLMFKKTISKRFLIAWNLIGLAIILLPLIAATSYWMNEPGFSFIFEFPMILAPSIVVPMLISINFLMAWNAFESTQQTEK